MMNEEEKLQKATEAIQELCKQCGLAMSKATEGFDKFAKAIVHVNKEWYEIELNNIKHNPSLNWFQKSARIRQLKRAAKQNGIDLN